jgi:hypothetical protein
MSPQDLYVERYITCCSLTKEAVLCLLPNLRAVCPCHAFHSTLTVGHCPCIVRIDCPLHLASELQCVCWSAQQCQVPRPLSCPHEPLVNVFSQLLMLRPG